MNRIVISFLALVLTILSPASNADSHVDPAHELLMVRVSSAFPEAMNAVQQAVVANGYELMRVQRVDIGLNKSGYKTAEYRIVFFGKKEEIKKLSAKHPTLIPFLPLKLIVFAEGDETIVLGANPAKLVSFYPDKKLEPYFLRWEKDYRKILRLVRS
jgi:uncharacterized protein (DUF302 family)